MDLEFLLWIGFLIVYGVIQSLGKKKKKPPQQVPTDLAEGERRPTTLQDALREIQEAFQEAQAQKESPQPEPQAPTEQPARTQLPRLAPSPSRETAREPEFHSLEKQIPERRLESKTVFSEKVFENKTLEASQTYEDSFPKSEFYDDKYSHAHMDSSSISESKTKTKKRSASEILRTRFKDKDYLSEAFIVQDILGKPVSKRHR